jgi:hypothetical protein
MKTTFSSCVCALLALAGCGEDAAKMDAETPARDMGDDMGAAPDLTPDLTPDLPQGDDASDDASDGEDADAECAPPGGQCPPDRPRFVRCRCVGEDDRRCDDDQDCRARERCLPLEGHLICTYEPPPVEVCPGAPGCEDEPGAPLLGAAVSRVITPTGFETPAPGGLDGALLNFSPGAPLTPARWRDCGYDDRCPGEPGYTGPDEGEGDNQLQGIWLAGFTTGRPAQACPPERVGCPEVDCCVSRWAHDDLKAQIAVLRQGQTTVAFVTLDVVGFFYSDLTAITRELPAALGVDLVVLGSTHNHEAPDTFGQWGPGRPAPLMTGRSPRFFAQIREAILGGIAEAVERLEAVTVEATVLDVGRRGLAINDSRAPYIFDDDVPVVLLRRARDRGVVATLASFGNHAEALWADNPYLTADHFGAARRFIEGGLPATSAQDPEGEKPALEGLGGVTLLFAGAVGGLINPGGGGALDYAGYAPADPHSFAAAEAIGQRLASHLLGAVHGGQLEDLGAPRLRTARRQLLTTVDNTVFVLAASVLGLVPREVYNTARLNNVTFVPRPQVLTEVAAVQLGPVTLFTAPGEVFPESLVGGYPGKERVRNPVIGDTEGRSVAPTCDDQGLHAPGGDQPCLIKPDQPFPPDWSAAPDGPYVYAQAPGRYAFFIGLGQDALGYLVPAYDYAADDYFNQAPGDHYEETNGVGASIEADWRRALGECFDALR